MGLSLFPVFERKIKIPTSKTGGETLGASFETLDEIAGKLGLPAISSFSDSREVPEDFDGAPEELDDLLGPCKDWYEAKAGAKALRDLAKAISADPKLTKRLKDAKGELLDLATQLDAAAAKGVRFRFDLG